MLVPGSRSGPASFENTLAAVNYELCTGSFSSSGLLEFIFLSVFSDHTKRHSSKLGGPGCIVEINKDVRVQHRGRMVEGE